MNHINEVLCQKIILQWLFKIRCTFEIYVHHLGVIFALKVITTHMLPSGVHYVMGMFPVPSRYAVWAELVIIQILVPNASFLGMYANRCIRNFFSGSPHQNISVSLCSL